MKISIVNPDNTIAEILMGEHQPSLETINNELLFFENYQYKLIIRDSVNCENIELFVGDYSISLYYNAITDCYETDTGLIFGGCFDLAYISIYIDDGYGKEKKYFTDFLRIATTKQTAKRVEHMLIEIEDNLPNFLDICFSKNRKKSGLIKNDVRSIWNTLKIVDEIINIYEENCGYFNNHKKAVVEPIAAVVDTRSMKIIDQESLRWIVCNPDSLISTNKDTGIIVEDKKYLPLKVKTYKSQYSYNVYENRVVLGFLKNVINYLDDQICGFNKEIIELKNIPDKIVAQLPNTHELTARCVYIYYKGIIERFSSKRDALQTIFYKYTRILECLPLEMYAPPKLTNTFKQVYHYRLCYECMIKWFEAGDYTFDHLNYLFKLKTLSRIFEYFCLIKIQNALNLCGYILQRSDRIIYDEEEDNEEINNLYVFYGNGYEVTLLYEPFIWVDKVYANINLYSTGFNFVKGKWNDKWTPDFIIKVACNDRNYYYILDAKYSNAINVKKRYMSELVLKYSTQIASKDKFFSDVVAVGAIYPGEEDIMYFFKRNVVNSNKISLPQYFSLTILGDSEGNNILKKRLNELLKIVNTIESEREEKDIRLVTREEIQRDDIIQKDKPVEDQSIIEKENIYDKKVEKTDLLDNATDRMKKHVAVSINGKKCFYYGKKLCLYKKAICDVGERPCEYYILKNSKKLLKEDTCRNFIRKGKGKVNVECSVSGIPGCVGSENCKFFMKKNKSKK